MLHVAFVEWVGGKGPCRAQRLWPATHSFPPFITGQPPDAELINDIFKYALSRMVDQHPLKPEVVAKLQQLNIPVRPPAQAERWRKWAVLLKKTPDRFR